MENEAIQSSSVVLGLLAIISLLVREVFSYFKSRNGNGNSNHDAAILQELRTMNTNHLHSLEDAINEGNRNLVETIHNDNTRMIELLGEIKGSLRN